jgi:hypothetical protein
LNAAQAIYAEGSVIPVVMDEVEARLHARLTEEERDEARRINMIRSRLAEQLQTREEAHVQIDQLATMEAEINTLRTTLDHHITSVTGAETRDEWQRTLQAEAVSRIYERAIQRAERESRVVASGTLEFLTARNNPIPAPATFHWLITPDTPVENIPMQHRHAVCNALYGQCTPEERALLMEINNARRIIRDDYLVWWNDESRGDDDASYVVADDVLNYNFGLLPLNMHPSSVWIGTGGAGDGVRWHNAADAEIE